MTDAGPSRARLIAYCRTLIASERGAPSAALGDAGRDAASALDPDDTRDALIEFTASTDVIDRAGFAARVIDQLAKTDPRLARARGRILAPLLCTIARESADAGWDEVAADCARQATQFSARLRLSRDTRAWIRGRDRAQTDPRNAALVTELARISGALRAAGIAIALVGTVALSFRAGRFLKRHEDLDFATSRHDTFTSVVAELERALGYRVAESYEWTSFSGDLAQWRLLRSAAGVAIEVAYLPHWSDGGDGPRPLKHGPLRPETAAEAFGLSVTTLDLRDLRHMYIEFLLLHDATNAGAKRQSDKNAILAIDRLLGEPPTLVAPGVD